MSDHTRAEDTAAPVHSSDAGADKDIMDRLERDPSDKDAKIDRGCDESMDASDPPSTSHPGQSDEPVPSSGYDADAERQRTS